MSYTNLRDYIEELKRQDLLRIIDEQVCKDTELVPLVRLQFRGLPESERRAFWFRDVTDARRRNFDASVVLGSLGCSRAVYAAALGVDVDEIGARWAQAQGTHLLPEQVAQDQAPCKEVVLTAPDLEGGVDRFPHLVSTPASIPRPSSPLASG